MLASIRAVRASRWFAARQPAFLSTNISVPGLGQVSMLATGDSTIWTRLSLINAQHTIAWEDVQI